MKYKKEFISWLNGEHVQYKLISMDGSAWIDLPPFVEDIPELNLSEKRYFLDLENWNGITEFRVKSESTLKKIRLALMCTKNDNHYYLLSIDEEDDLYGIPTYVDFVKWVSDIFSINFEELSRLDKKYNIIVS